MTPALLKKIFKNETLSTYTDILNKIDSRSKIGGVTPSFLMRKLLIPLFFSLALPIAVSAGIPLEKDTWVEIDSKRGSYQINTADAKASGSKVTVGVS